MMTRRFAMGLVFTLLCGAAVAGTKELQDGDVLVFFGDSITKQGVQKGGFVMLVDQAIKKAYPLRDIKVHAAGDIGRRVPDCEKHLDRLVLAKKPTVVVICIGNQDVFHSAYGTGTSKKDFYDGLRRIIGKLKNHKARVIMCTPTVIGERKGKNKYDKMLDEYAALGLKAGRDSGAQLLDLRKAFVDYLRKNNPRDAHKGILTHDSIHLTAKGNRLMADLMIRALNIRQ